MEKEEIEEGQNKEPAEKNKKYIEQKGLLQKLRFFNITKILIIVIITLIVIISIVVLASFFWGDNGGEVGGKSTLSLEEKLKLCLEKDVMDKDCEMLFIDPDRYKDCEKIEDLELRDKCFYQTAIIGIRSDICNKIENSDLKNDCYREGPPYVP